MCDGIQDCPDGIDEFSCEYILFNSKDILSHSIKFFFELSNLLLWIIFFTLGQDSCGSNFRCSNSSNMCIMSQAHCDGIWDCENGTDEESCGKSYFS